VVTGKADSISNHFFTVGHTHNLVDQRFSILGTSLSNSPVLETPTDFLRVIKQHLKPGRHRTLVHTEVLDGIYNWKQFWEPLGISIAGVAPTHWDPIVNHVWRVVRRGDLVQYEKKDDWEIVVPED